ncbi:MAG: hypothetical protein IJD72_00210 [Alistipes sp.]|nr:hypothetical protein [Alistipes sp.]
MIRQTNILHLVVALALALCTVGCYENTVGYTIFRTAVKIQSTEGGDYVGARDLYTYAYYVDTTEWRIANYDDACNMIITNKLSGERRETPDVYGEMNPSSEYQLSMVINEPLTLMVVVDPANKVYAYRPFTLPINLPQIDTKLYIAAWRNSHSTGGWRVVNEFYKAPQPEPDPEPEPDEPGTEPEPSPQPNPDEPNPDEPNNPDGEGDGNEGGNEGEGGNEDGNEGNGNEGNGGDDEGDNNEGDGSEDDTTDTPTDTPTTDND